MYGIIALVLVIIVAIIAIIALILAIMAYGKGTGPVGPAGPEGEQGPQGKPGKNSYYIDKINRSKAGSDKNEIITLDIVPGTNYVFNGHNCDKHSNSVMVRILSSKCEIGDVFLITNKSENIKLYLNPQGFSNFNTTGFDKDHVLLPKETNTALFLVTVGTTLKNKDIVMLMSGE